MFRGKIVESFVVLVCALFASAVCFQSVALCAAKKQGGGKSPSVYINGVQLPLDFPAKERGGELFVPVTAEVMLSLGGVHDLSLSDGITTVQITIMGRSMEFTEGDVRYSVDGEVKQAVAAPFLESDGVLMVPAKDFFTALDATVEWNASQMKLLVVKKLEDKKIREQLPPEVFVPSATATVDAATSTVSGDGSLTDAELEAMLASGKRVQYTYDSATLFTIETVGGDRTKSNLAPKQIFQDKVSLRLEGNAGHGYKLDGQFNPVVSTDRYTKKGEMQKANITLSKDKHSLGLIDLIPKYSQYLMKNYRVQGAQIKSMEGKVSFDFVAGKSPKKVKDSEYARYVGAFRMRLGDDVRNFAINFASTQDTGGVRKKDMSDNRVLSLSGIGKFTKNWTWNSEFAHSNTDVLNRSTSSRGNAFVFNSKRSAKKSTLEMSYESTSLDFISRTAVLTQGKHEFSLMYNGSYGTKVTFGAGHKNRLLKGVRTYIMPTMVSIKPLKRRKNLKIDLRQNYERSFGVSRTLIDNRTYVYRDTLKKMDLTTTRGRKKTRNASNVTTFRDSFEYKALYQLSDKRSFSWQYNKEKVQRSSTPMARTFRYKLSNELGEWTDLNIGFERFYNNTTSDRYGYTISYRSLNIDTSTEISVELGFTNYRRHNENSVKIGYNISK